MIGKIPTWWENSVLRNGNMIGKIPTWWENPVRERKTIFRCMDHLVLRHPSYNICGDLPSPFLSVYVDKSEHFAGVLRNVRGRPTAKPSPTGL
jgi:hypothetical protein